MESTKAKSQRCRKTYHFCCGNSTKGVIGLCAVVVATTKRQAVRTLRRALLTRVGLCDELPVGSHDRDLEYINVYVRPENLRISHIDAERHNALGR